MTMPHLEEHLTTADGLKLYWQRWSPDGPAKATVLLVDGFTGHSGRYAQLAEHLNRHGYAVDTADLRGPSL